MNPNQPTPPQTPLSSDYLNQIAPVGPKKSLFSFGLKQIIMIAGAAIVLVIILSVVVNGIAGSKRGPLEHLSARLTATEVVVTDAQENLKSSKLRSLNSNLKLYMTNTNRDISAPLLSAGINAAKISKNVTAAEAATTASMSLRLEDARLNAVFDRTYAREMAYQLGTLLTLMGQTYNATGDPELKTFLKTSYDNLKPTQESFAGFTTITE